MIDFQKSRLISFLTTTLAALTPPLSRTCEYFGVRRMKRKRKRKKRKKRGKRKMRKGRES